jgi:predicted TIM-barrel fold metal-dependent hydrolase
VSDSGQPYVLISCDAHAGAEVKGYKPYLEREFHEEFDAWAATFREPWSDLDVELAQDDPNLRVGVASFLSPYNWDNDKRIAHMDDQGIAAEVVFPNTVPPFYPANVVAASAPSNPEEYRRRWAGVKAHNRWLVDFCAQAPGRRGGLAQVFLTDVDDAVSEVRWAKESGLVGILIPSDHITQLVNLYERRLDPFWATCAELAMPVVRHSIAVSPPETPDTEAIAPAIGVHETFLFFSRGLAHMIFSGVFERYPDLRFILTETGLVTVSMQLAQMDVEYRYGQDKRSAAYPYFHRVVDAMSRTPTEYFNRNCYVGDSLMVAMDVGMRHQIGVDRIMWGADYPHHEGTYPHTRLALRLNFSDVPEDEVRAMTSLNAAQAYGFDLEFLQGIAERIGPTVSEVATPVPADQIPLDTRGMTIFDALEPVITR